MRLLLAALMMLCVAPAAGQGMRPGAVADEAVVLVIRPAMTNFRREADGLLQAMTGLCATPSERSLVLAQDRFATTLLAFGRIEPLRIGPALEDKRSARLLAPPGSVPPEDGALDAGLSGPLADAPAAAQGLGALEAVLFAPGSAALHSTEGAARCQYGLAIAQAAWQIGEELLAGWYSPRGVAIRLMAPRPEYPDYRSDADAIAALAKVLSEGVVLMLERAAGMNDGRGGQFAASGLTRALVRSNLAGLTALYRLSGIGRAANDGEASHARIGAALVAMAEAIEDGSDPAMAEFSRIGVALQSELAGLPALIETDG